MSEKIKNFFVENWIRKVISIFFATIIWFMVNDSLHKSKNFHFSNSLIEEDINNNAP